MCWKYGPSRIFQIFDTIRFFYLLNEIKNLRSECTAVKIWKSGTVPYFCGDIPECEYPTHDQGSASGTGSPGSRSPGRGNLPGLDPGTENFPGHGPGPVPTLAHDALKIAIQNFDEKFLFVGLTEDFGNFMKILEKMIPGYFKDLYFNYEGKIFVENPHTWEFFRNIWLCPITHFNAKQRFSRRANFENHRGTTRKNAVWAEILRPCQYDISWAEKILSWEWKSSWTLAKNQ